MPDVDNYFVTNIYNNYNNFSGFPLEAVWSTNSIKAFKFDYSQSQYVAEPVKFPNLTKDHVPLVDGKTYYYCNITTYLPYDIEGFLEGSMFSANYLDTLIQPVTVKNSYQSYKKVELTDGGIVDSYNLWSSLKLLKKELRELIKPDAHDKHISGFIHGLNNQQAYLLANIDKFKSEQKKAEQRTTLVFVSPVSLIRPAVMGQAKLIKTRSFNIGYLKAISKEPVSFYSSSWPCSFYQMLFNDSVSVAKPVSAMSHSLYVSSPDIPLEVCVDAYLQYEWYRVKNFLNRRNALYRWLNN